MKAKHRFYFSIAMLQVLLVVISLLIINQLTGIGLAQTPELPTAGYDTQTAMVLGASAAAAIVGSTMAAGITIKTVGTAAISALTENEDVFFKAFLVIALGEALAIYGLIVSILLWIKIPTP